MNSELFQLNQNDVVRSVVTSVMVAVVAAIYGVTSAGNFDLFATDWSYVGKLVVNTAFITLMARLAEKLLSKDGKLFGRIG